MIFNKQKAPQIADAMKPLGTLLNTSWFIAAFSAAFLFLPSLAFAFDTTWTTPGTYSWTCPNGISSVTVQCWGAGGAGGGNTGSVNGAGGGGGGAYAKGSYSVSGGSSYSITVGTGGTGASNANGNPGGETYWVNNTSICAKGGSGGQSNANGRGGGAGGLASSSYGNLAKYDGGYGESGYVAANGKGGWGGSSAGTAADGHSDNSSPSYSINTYPTASTPAGGSHGGNGGSGSAVGGDASGYGGGGGGSGEGANAGGAGTPGKVIITYTPTVTIAGSSSQFASASAGATDQILGKATFQNNCSNSSITAVTISEITAYTANGNITNVEVCWSTDGSWNTTNQIGSASSTWSGEAITFTETFSSITTQQYLVVRADLPTAAAGGTGIDFTIGITTSDNTSGSPVNFSGTSEIIGSTADPNIYYSVGTTATALYSASGISATGGVMTLTGSPATNIGLGDEVRVGAGPDYYYYIRRRDDATHFRLEKCARSSAIPGDTTITITNQSVSIYRAFNSLSTAIANAGDVSHLGATDLTTNSNILHFVCYGDGNDAYAAVAGYTTSATNYIRIFTPVSSTEVGVSQRHNGKWKASGAYTITRSTTGNSQTVVSLDIPYVRVEGLQVALTANNLTVGGIGLNHATGGFWVSHNIIKKAGGGSVCNGVTGNTNGPAYIYNNIAYDFSGNGFDPNGTGAYYIYNNTAYGCATGFKCYTNNSITAINNIAQKVTTGFGGTGTYNAASCYNISDKADAAGTSSKNSTTVIFVDSANDDFHLSSNDVEARNAGTNLAADANLSFTDDLEKQTRPWWGTWDIGADEDTLPAIHGGWTADDVIPTAQVNQQTNGTGTVQVDFKIRHEGAATCDLSSFGYSIDGGAIWNTPTNGDVSTMLTGNWPTKGGSHFPSATTLASATAQNFTFNSKHDSLYVRPVWSGSTTGSSLSGPKGIALSGNRLYVVDYANDRVQVINATSLAWIQNFGATGTGNGQFSEPACIVVSGGKIFISDKGATTHRISVWDEATLTWLAHISYADWATETAVNGITCYKGHLYVVVDNTWHVYKFKESDLSYVDKRIDQPVNPGFNSIIANGYIYGIQNRRYDAWQIDDNMANWTEYNSFDYPDGTGVGQAKNFCGSAYYGGIIYAVDQVANRITVIRASDASIIENFASVGSGSNQVSAPEYAAAYNGKLYVSDRTNNRVAIWDLKAPQALNSTRSGSRQLTAARLLHTQPRKILQSTRCHPKSRTSTRDPAPRLGIAWSFIPPWPPAPEK